MRAPEVFSAASPVEQTQDTLKGETKQGFAYMSGGVGEDEREVMEKMVKNYNLHLVFAEKSGQYLSDVQVVIERTDGTEIVSATTNGPWLYIQLPAGTYRVKATFRGKTKEIKNLRLKKDDRVRQTLLWELD